MKKYILFAYNHHYPRGGLDDVIGSYDTQEEAFQAKNTSKKFDFYEIVNRDTWKRIFCSYSNEGWLRTK